jgi:Transglutaminase-like superfamily
MPIFECRLDMPVPFIGNYIFPKAIDTNEQAILDIRFENAEPIDEVLDLDGSTWAYLFSLKEGQTPKISMVFDEPGPGLAEAEFVPRNSRFDQPSQALMDQVNSQFEDVPLSERVGMILQFVGDHFTYGARDKHLGEESEAMPALECGLTPGNCVDMHTLGVAALRSMDVAACYVMGCHISEGKLEGPTGHCWMNVRHEGVPHHWDISHHIQYGVRKITPALNPKPGRRFAMSVGRGPVFAGLQGSVEYPSLSGFHALDGPSKGQKLRTIGRFID